jgi:hypothetical protein
LLAGGLLDGLLLSLLKLLELGLCIQ